VVAVGEQMTTDLAVPRLAYNQRDAAALLSVSDRTLRRWEASGLVRSVTVDGVKLYPRAELERLVKLPPAGGVEA
jgi:hypothetical protein